MMRTNISTSKPGHENRIWAPGVKSNVRKISIKIKSEKLTKGHPATIFAYKAKEKKLAQVKKNPPENNYKYKA